MLCGGLAESKYIQYQLKAFCRESIPNAQVIVPPSPWSAICCGAAMRESGKSFISSRRARRSYGTVLLEPFVDGEHEEKDATQHPELGTMVQKMLWHIKRVRHAAHANDYGWLLTFCVRTRKCCLARSTDGSRMLPYILAVNLATKGSSKYIRATTWQPQPGNLTRVSLISCTLPIMNIV